MTSKSPSNRDRFLRTLRYESVNRRPVYLAAPWHDTLLRWNREGLPANVDDVHEHMGVKAFGFNISNITPIAGPHPADVGRIGTGES